MVGLVARGIRTCFTKITLIIQRKCRNKYITYFKESLPKFLKLLKTDVYLSCVGLRKALPLKDVSGQL